MTTGLKKPALRLRLIRAGLLLLGCATIAMAVGGDALGLGRLPGFGLKQAQLAYSGCLLLLSGLVAGPTGIARGAARAPARAESARWRPVLYGAAVGLLGLAGMALVLLDTRNNGPGLSLDSREYLAAAESLLAGRGYRAVGGNPFVHWPPLFPTVLVLQRDFCRDRPGA